MLTYRNLVLRLQPKPNIVRRTEARNYGYRLLPCTIISPDHARPARSENPLVCSRDKKVTAQFAYILIFYAETMDSIDTK